MMAAMDDSATVTAQPAPAPKAGAGARIPLLALALAVLAVVVMWFWGYLPWVIDGYRPDAALRAPPSKIGCASCAPSDQNRL